MLDQAQITTDQQKKIELYEEALTLFGDRKEPYQEMIKAFKSDDGKFTIEEEKTLLKYYQKNGRGWEPEKEFPWGALYIALITAAIVTYFYKLGLLATMSNVNKQVEANAYLNKESFTLKESEDSFMYSTVTVPLVSSSKDNGSDDGSVTDSSSDGDHGGGGGDY